MSKKAQTTRSQKTSIACYAPGARELFVAGTFNNWNSHATPMRKGPNGQWIAELELAPGQHEYKFVADGKWCAEPGEPDDFCCAREGCVQNECGTLNRVLQVN